MHKALIFQKLLFFFSLHLLKSKFGYTKMLPINLTHTAEWSLSSKQIVHIAHYIPVHLYFTALHLDIANNLGSVNCSDIYKSGSSRMDCSENPRNHWNTTRLHTSTIKSLPRMLLPNVDYWRIIQFRVTATEVILK